MVDDFHYLDSFWYLYWSLMMELLRAMTCPMKSTFWIFILRLDFFSYNFIVNCFAVTERDLRNGEKYWLIRYLVTNLKEKQSDLALNKSNDYTTFSRCMNCIYFTASYGLFYLLKLTCTVQIVCYVFSLKQM